MKKMKVLAGALIISLAAMGAGYATWTDQISIGGSVATGTLNVEWDQSTQVALADTLVQADVSVDTSDPDKATFTVSNMYPGAMALVVLAAENKGTIPAKFTDAQMTVSGDTQVADFIRAYSGAVAVDENGFVKGGDVVSFDRPFSELANDFTNNGFMKGVNLQPGEKLFLDMPESANIDVNGDGKEENCIILKIADNAPNDIQGKTVTFTLDFNWKQGLPN